MRRLINSMLVAMSAATINVAAADNIVVMPHATSDNAGYNKGVSAMFAGEIDNQLIIAGGANFPETPAAEGGTKVYYNDIFLLQDSTWHKAGKLTVRTAYGMSASVGNAIVMIGGANADGSLSSVNRLTVVSADSVTVSPMPSLPYPLQEGAAAVVGKNIYILGGLSDGKAMSDILMLDTALPDSGWVKVATMPEPLAQPIASVSGDKIYFWGGYNKVQNRSSFKGYKFDPTTRQVKEIATHPQGGTFTGATAITVAHGEVLIFGGVDRQTFDNALKLPKEKTAEYLSQPVENYKFQRSVWYYMPDYNYWFFSERDERFARAGAMAVRTDNGTYLIGGEIKPGVRTPEILLIQYYK